MDTIQVFVAAAVLPGRSCCVVEVHKQPDLYGLRERVALRSCCLHLMFVSSL